MIQIDLSSDGEFEISLGFFQPGSKGWQFTLRMSYPDTAEHKYKQEIRNIYIKILLKDQWSFAFKWLGKNSLSPLSPIIKINKDMPVATNITDTEASSDGQRWKADIWNDSRQIMSAIVLCILFSCVNPLWLSVITSCQCFTKWQYNL